MKTVEILEIISRHRGNQPVMASSGPSQLMFRMGHRDPTIYQTGMSYTAPLAFGLALARPDLKAIAIEGDGAMLMGLAGLVTIGRYQPPNLVLVVVNNRTYRATDRGELETATAVRADLCGVAAAAGIHCSQTAETPEQFEDHFRRALGRTEPVVIIADVERESGPLSRRPKTGWAMERDRAEYSMVFRRYLAEHSPPPGGGSPAPRSGRVALIEQSEGPGRPASRHLYQCLIEEGVNFTVYLPDAQLYPLEELAERDPEMTAVCCTREDEGIAIAGGAVYGGRIPVVVMEGTATGFSGLILVHMMTRRIPMLIIASHSEALGVRSTHNDIAAKVNEPILRALSVHYVVLSHLRDARTVVRESLRAAEVFRSPAVVVVPPYLMDEEP